MEKDKSPICDNCSKESCLQWRGSIGATGAHLSSIGWIFKNAFMYTKKDTPLAFCSINCRDVYYTDVLLVTKQESDKINKAISEAREASLRSVPEMVKSINRFAKAIKGVKKNGR
jgi:hypothetical protein